MFSINRTPLKEFDPEKCGIKRQYTEAFCMRKDVYNALINIEKDPSLHDYLNACMEQNNQKDLCLSIKNYSRDFGLSAHVHN